MNKLFLLIFFILSTNAISQTKPFNAIKVNRDDAPYIFKLMIEHLKFYPLNKTDNIEIINNLKKLNKNFSHIDLINSLFLVNSESYKTILESQRVKKGPKASLQLSELEMAKKKEEKFYQIYTDFARFIIQSVVSDFEDFKENNFLSLAQNQSLSTTKNKKKFVKLKKILKYSAPWIHKINTTSPTLFNKELSPMIGNIIKNLAEQSQVFSIHAKNKVLENKSLLIGLNTPTIYQYLSESLKQNNINQIENPQSKAKSNAENDIQNLKVTIPPNVSQDIDKLMENIDNKQ